MFLKRFIHRTYQKLPLRIFVVVPFILQISAAVGLTGYIYLINGKKIVDEYAISLSNEVTKRIDEHVQNYLENAHLVQQTIASGIKSGTLNPKDLSELERYLWYQVQGSNLVSDLYFGNEKGEFIEIHQRDNGNTKLHLRDKSTAWQKKIYNLNSSGEKTNLIKTINFDPRNQFWYKSALEADQQTWSTVSLSPAYSVLEIKSGMPLYNQANRRIGILGISITLEQISDFLGQINITENGKAFIIDRSGHLIATSTEELPFVITETEPKRLHSSESQDPLVRATANHLLERFGSFEEAESLACSFAVIQKQELFQVTELEENKGLNWLIVVVIPETDFTEQITATTRNTFLLCLTALGVAIMFGLRTSKWIVQPILSLNTAAKKLSKGEWNQSLPVDRSDEIGEMAKSFNSMAEQLQASLHNLAKTNEELEQRVEQRTAALRKSEEALREKQAYLRLILDNIPQQVFWKDTNLVFRGCNKNWAEAAQLSSPKEVVGKTDYDLLLDHKTAEFFRMQDRQIIETDIPKLHIIATKERPGSNGEIIWLDINKIPIHDEQGKVIGILGVLADITERKQAEEALNAEKEKSEKLLLNILPQVIAEQLKQDQSAIAEQLDEVTILFADIVGFTPLASKMSPTALVNLLNEIFSIFDQLAEKHGLEKIKTIGDAYMVGGGLPMPRADHAEAIADMALDMQKAIKQFQVNKDKPFQIRIGINTGAVVAGVIGIKKFIYDLWGDAVNVASRMESSGMPGKIQVTSETYERLKDKYLFEKRGAIAIKGKGEMVTYWLRGERGNR